MHPWAAFRADVEQLFAQALASVGHEGPLLGLAPSPDPKMGDLGMPCFALAKSLKAAPPAIATRLAEAIEIPSGSWVKEVRAVGPFLNAFIDRGRLAAEVLGDMEGLLAPGADGRQKILLEHTSANPNGPLHVGRARNPILGDTFARLLRAAGHDVETQYYMDNLGRQVALLYWGHAHREELELGPLGRDKPDHDLVRCYQAANERMEQDPAVKEEIRLLVAELEQAPPELVAKVRPVYEACFGGMRASLTRLGVTYDTIKDESDLVTEGEVERVIGELQDSPRAGREDDGANYLDLSKELAGNKSTKFFFTRKDQTSVYATRDVAYHQWKAERVGADGRLLNVLGEDHRLQSLQVGIALEELGHRRPDVVFYSFVTLPDGKMSTRVGRVVFLDDLLDEAVARAAAEVKARRGDELSDEEQAAIAEAVGMGAIRFSIIKIQPEKPIEFRWEDALAFDGESGPYLQYATARAASLLRKAADEGIPATADAPAGPGEEKLLAKVAEYPAALAAAADDLAPHRFAAYTLELAQAFNDYYRDHPVVACEDAALRATRVATVAAAHRTLSASLDNLGVPVLQEM